MVGGYTESKIRMKKKHREEEREMQKEDHLLFQEAQGPAIRIVGLTKVYRGRNGQVTKAVDHLHLEVPRGQVFGFLGANGAGKTTTIKTLCGLIIPESGQVYVNGYQVAYERSLAMRQIGAVLEGTRNVYWRLSAWQNLLYFGRLKGCGGRELKERATRLLRELDLWERRNDPLRSFSRGMQQKVAIACALIADPPIVLLDEPTLGLDIQAALTVKAWVARLAREQGKTVVLTTHQLDIAQELCDRVAIMRRGKLLADQPLSDLLQLFKQEHYQIRLRGELAPEQAAHFQPLSLIQENGQSLLSGEIRDQQTLHDYLEGLYPLG